MTQHAKPPTSPIVTIGMPVHNGARYIREALDSVLIQTFRDYELIISDNASDDDTESICMDYRSKDPRIRYVRQKHNLGAHNNFNFVTQNARGHLFTWLAHDDILEPAFLEKTVQFMSDNPNAVLVASDFGLIDQDGAPTGVEHLISIRQQIAWENRISEFFKYPISNVFFCIYGLTRTEACKSVLRSVGQPKMFAGSELPFLARFAILGEVSSIPLVLRKYRKHPSSVYFTEAAEIAKKSLLRRKIIQFRKRYRLRRDQMIVLWSSSLSKSLKLLVSVEVLLFSLRIAYFRIVRVLSRITGISQSKSIT